MCGISIIIRKKDRDGIEEDIKSMNDLISHRGPDDEGYYFSDKIAFGHRRLSILDLSSAGQQPMHYLDKYVITYNGEIYNYLEIRDILEENGYSFDSQTDTEVILAAYDFWGEKCLSHFNGMWAFAIHDIVENTVFCSRDRFGVKPLYYLNTSEYIIIGSEIRQLLYFVETPKVNEKILIDYVLYNLEEHTNETFFDSIYKLEPSHNLKINCLTNEFEIKNYFELKTSSVTTIEKEQDVLNFIEKKINTSVKIRLRSDVQVGTCLSGGLDSSSIASIAKKHYNGKSRFIAIHAKSIENKTDESYFAQSVAKHLDLDLKVIEPDLDEITKAFEEVIIAQEEPFGGPSVIMQYFVMQKAKNINCKVLLDGQGGDETLFGYERYYTYYLSSLLRGGRIFSYFYHLFTIDLFKIKRTRLFRDSLILPVRNKLSKVESFFRKNKYKIKSKFSRRRLDQFFKFTSFKEYQKREVVKTCLPHLLRYEDKNSMWHSIETRLPFVDYDYLQSALLVPDKMKFKKGFLKYILRKIVSSCLPEEIVWRKNKYGFEAPADLLIKKNKSMMISKIDESLIIKSVFDLNIDSRTDNKTLWKLYNISVWETAFKVAV